MFDFYKVGGSLRHDHPTYITRKADREIYGALRQQEFCYVLNSRQMGKSSLRVRTMKSLTKEGFKCVAIDLGILGRFTTDEQWYGGLLAELWRKLRLTKGLDDDLEWWRSHEDLPPVSRFNRFIEDVLLVNCSQNIVIFLDEIDNIIKLDFRDEFLILIRNCYEKRVESKQYHRLTFCLLGVATPSSLRIDKQLSPFNIGRAIHLSGFNFAESQPLLSGLNKFQQPEIILQQVLNLTQGQPFLTQKLCSLITRHGESNVTSISELIEARLINNWEIQDEPEHLKTIRDRLLHNQNKDRLLNLYQRIITGKKVAIDGNDEQIELRLSGLVTAQQNELKVSNPIYQQVFDRDWVAKQLFAISPYQNAYSAWVNSYRQDKSRLLRGEALVEGQNWARMHTITSTENAFLQASKDLAVEENKQAELAQQAEYVSRKLAQKKQLIRWQTLFILFSLAMLTGFYLKSRQANFSNIATIVQSSEALAASNQKLDALIAAIKAKRKLDKSIRVNRELTEKVDAALQQVVYQIKEKNRLLGHSDRLYGIATSSDGKLMATAATDNTVRLWQKDATGWKLSQVLKHDGWVLDVAIGQLSRSSQPSSKGALNKEIIVASASRDRTVKLWNQNGKLLQTLKHAKPVTSVAIHHGQIITGSEDGKIYLWQQGKLVKTIAGHTAAVEAIATTPDRRIITASEDKTIKIWQQGKLVKTLLGHTEGVRTLAISENRIISGSRDKTLKIWDFNGREITTLTGHLAPVYGVAVNPVNQQIVSVSGDNTLKVWDERGTEIATLRGHTNRVWDVAYLENGNIASASWDETIRIWQPNNNFSKILTGHQDVVIALDYDVLKDGKNLIASASDDKTVKLWNQTGTLLKTFRQHTAEVYDVAIKDQTIATVGADKTLRIWHLNRDWVRTIKAHNAAIWAVDITTDGQKIVTAGNDNLIKIWNLHGNLLQTFKGHTQKVWNVAISPNNQYLLSASEDKTVKVWDLQGNLRHTLKGHTDAVRTIVAGKQIFSGGEDRTIKIWDFQGNLVDSFNEHNHSIKALALSPNQQYLASADDRGKIILWQQTRQTWQPAKTIQSQDSSLWSIAFSPDGQTLATTGEDAQITLWNIANILQLSPLEYGCNWIKEYLNHSFEIAKSERQLCSDSN